MSELLEVGRISRAHGIRGEVIVDLITDRTERVAPGSQLTGPAGDVFEVEESRPHQGRWIVRFAGVPDRSAAEALRGTVLRAAPIDDPGEMWVHQLIGSVVVDGQGHEVGEVTAVEQNPAADLLVLDTGALIPVVFVSGWEPGRVDVDLPEGLLDL